MDQVCGEMVIQRKMEVIYSERDPRSAFKCEDVKVANILLCHGRQYKYWYICIILHYGKLKENRQGHLRDKISSFVEILCLCATWLRGVLTFGTMLL